MIGRYWYIIGLLVVAAVVCSGLWANISEPKTRMTTEKIHMLPGVNDQSSPLTTGSSR
jgi:hypothetical protein